MCESRTAELRDIVYSLCGSETTELQVTGYSLCGGGTARLKVKALLWKRNCDTSSRTKFIVWKQNCVTSKPHYFPCVEAELRHFRAPSHTLFCMRNGSRSRYLMASPKLATSRYFLLVRTANMHQSGCQARTPAGGGGC